MVANMAPAVGAEGRGHILAPLLSAVALLLLLCGLCTLCKRRRKRRIVRNVCSNRVALVDVTLLRQTQLRSLSKSDTRLHEIKRPRPGDSQLRPVSMDPLYHSPHWLMPTNAPSAEDATYSNLNYNPKTSLYECVGPGTRAVKEPSPSEPKVNVVTAEYACVRKVKKAANQRSPEPREEERTQEPAPDPEPCLPSRPTDLKLEDMYSKVQKKKKPAGTESTEGLIQTCGQDGAHPESPICSPEENLYESISDMGSPHTTCSPTSDLYE